MKTVTFEEAMKLLSDIGHQSHITVPFLENGEENWRTVLNNAMVYNPIPAAKMRQIGMSSNEKNAKTAMNFIAPIGRFKLYSAYFSYANNEYVIED